MKYLSPNSLFSGILAPPLDKKAIQLGRKKLLAELELAGGESVVVSGKSYDKNEIIRFFEELLAENCLEYHNAISADNVLLGFLQDQHLEAGARFVRQNIYQDDAFIRWISPYYSQSFWQLIHDAFLHSDDLGMATLLNNPLLMTVVDQEKTWTEIARLITGEIDLLERYFDANRRRVAKWRDTGMPTTTVADIMDYDHVRLLCLLPEGRFAELRNKYAFAMMQASIATFNRHPGKRDISETWIINAETLAVSPELKNQLVDKLAEFRNIRKKRSPANFRWIFIAIVAVNAVRLISNNRDNSSPDFRNVRVNFTNPPKTHEDSLFRNLFDSGGRQHHLEFPPPSIPSNQYH